MSGDTFSPQTIDLSAGAIQLIRTALGFPKVTFDKTGLRSYDANGNLVLAIYADGSALLSGDIKLPTALAAGGPLAPSAVEWYDPVTGAIQFYIQSQMTAEGQPPALNIFSGDQQVQLQVSAAGISVAASAGLHPGLWLQKADGSSNLLQVAQNLADVVNAATARANLGAAPTNAPTFTGNSTFAGTVTLDDSTGVRQLAVGSTNGTKFGGSAASLIGFYGATPRTQPSSTGATGRTGGTITGITYHPDDTYTGGTGTTGYTIGDIVKHLKELGLLAP